MAAVSFPSNPAPFDVYVAPGTNQRYQFLSGRWVAVENAKKLRKPESWAEMPLSSPYRKVVLRASTL